MPLADTPVPDAWREAATRSSTEEETVAPMAENDENADAGTLEDPREAGEKPPYPEQQLEFGVVDLAPDDALCF